MASRPLTDIAIRKLKPRAGKRFELWDGSLPGFGVRVSGKGTKSFVVLYRLHGRPKRLTLGRYPMLSLAEAREKAREALAMAAEGRDPQAKRRTRSTSHGFADVVASFVTLHCERHNRASTTKETRRMLEQHFVSQWGNRDVREIERQDVLAVLDGLVARGTGSTANHALAAIRKFMNWCVERGLLEMSPCTGVRAPAPKVARSRVLSDEELAAVWAALASAGAPFDTIVRLLILTGQRRTEVAEMRWEEVDLEQRLWTLPEARNKSAREHIVPLTDMAVALLRTHGRERIDSGFLFPSRRTPGRVFSGFSKCKRRLDDASGVSDWRLHDIRRTVATGMARLGVAPHVVERVLNHSSGTFAGVAGVYNRFGYLPEMRDALERWERHVLGLVTGK